MDISLMFQLCSAAIAQQLGEKRKRRAQQLRRKLGVESLEWRTMMDAAADYANAIAAAQAAWNTSLIAANAAWQTAEQGADDSLGTQLAALSSDQAAFDQAANQDTANTIATATTTEQNSNTAAAQQASALDQAADSTQQQQIQQAQATEASQDATLQAQFNTTKSNETAVTTTALTNDQNTFNSTMATDQSQHDSAVSSDIAAVQATEQTDLNQASTSDAAIQANLTSQINAAAASRDATINGATPSVDASTAAANSAAYQATVTSATSSYNTAVANLQAAENWAFASADATQAQKLGAASTQLASDQQTAQQNKITATQAANNAYNQAIVPFQTTLNNTLVADQATYNSSMQTATNTYNNDMQTAANMQTASQQAADSAYNSAAQPLTDAYNTWLTGRTTQYNNDLQAAQNSLNSAIASEENNYANKVAGYLTTENNAIQAAWAAYNSAVAGFTATQQASDQTAWAGYNSAVTGAQQTLSTAQATYNNTVGQIYQQAQQNHQPPDQGALQAAYATLQTAYHAYANTTAGAAVALQASLGTDEMTWVNSEGPVYVTLEDAIAGATAAYDMSVASAEHTKDDNEADDDASADTQASSIGTAYQNDVETHYEALQLQLAPLVQAREDAYADAANQYLDDTLAAKAKLMNSQGDATQTQSKADTDAYTAYYLGIDPAWQTLQEQLAQADATLADALAKANTTYNTSVMAADIQDTEAHVSALVAYDAGVAAQAVAWVQQVAPAWANAVIAASGNDPGTTTWANAWSAYVIAAAQLTAGAAGQVDQIFQSVQDTIIELGTNLCAQISAADQTLADQAGQAEVTKATNDTTTILAYDGVVVPAGGTLAKGEIDDARTEITAEINADKQDGIAHGNNAAALVKAEDAAEKTALQQEDPEIMANDNSKRSHASANIAKADQDQDTAIEAVDAATEVRVDSLAGPGQTLVDAEANADKTYTKAKAQNQVNLANAEAVLTAATLASQPDSNFNAPMQVSPPGIYIVIYPGNGGVGHAEFYLPILADGNKVVGWNYLSFFAQNWNPGGGWFATAVKMGKAVVGWEDGGYTNAVLPATFDPKTGLGAGPNQLPTADWFIPTDMEALHAMRAYALGRATAQDGWDKTNYCALTGNTCTGFVIDTMDAGNIWPWWSMQALPNGFDLSGAIKVILTGEGDTPIAEKLPAYNPMKMY